MGLLKKVDEAVEKVQENLNEIPHRKGKVKKIKEENKLETMERELKRYEDEVKSLERKFNRKEKELKASENREKRQKERIGTLTGKLEKLKRDIGKEESKIEWLENKLREVTQELETVTTELEEYKEKEDKNKKAGLDVNELLKELTTLEEEVEALKIEKGESLAQHTVREKRLKRHINGEKRAKSRLNKKLAEKELEVKLLQKEIRSFDLERSRLESEVRYSDEKSLSDRQELYQYKNNPKKMLEQLTNLLSEETFEGYKELDKFLEKYEEVKGQVESKQKFIGEELGYIITEGKKRYFISLEDETAGVIDNLGDVFVQEGSVCRANIYEDNRVEIIEVYKTGRVQHKKYTKQKQEKVKRVKKSARGNVIGVDNFFNSIYKYNILIITAKSVRNYRDYFYKYGVIDVQDPFSEGERKIKRAIDKADIVVVRTDAAPHDITDYLKETKKEDTLFMYNAKSKDVAYAISKKALSKG